MSRRKSKDSRLESFYANRETLLNALYVFLAISSFVAPFIFYQIYH